MGKVGDKPRTSERKCRRKRRKQRTSRKKGQCDRVNAPKAKERVHDVAKNINEDGSVPRVPDFAVVEVPTRVNATEGKVHLEQNPCSFEFDLPSLSSVGRSRPNSACGGVGHERRCEGKSKSGDVTGNIGWRKKSKQAVLMGGQPDPSRALLMGGAVLMGGHYSTQTSVQAETSGVHQADVTNFAEDRSITWRKEPRQLDAAESCSIQGDLTQDRPSEATRALPTLVGENVTGRTEGSETVAQVPDNEVSYGASGLPRPPDQSQPHPGAQPGAHQGGRMEQTRADQGAQSCAHIGAESGRVPEAQDLENAREPDHIRLAEKAGEELTSGESCLIERDRLSRESHLVIDVIR
ncbi:hypothetical protein GQ457_01G005890 [Hibiscus cannabinus]